MEHRIVVTLLITGDAQRASDVTQQIENYAESLDGVEVERRSYRGSSKTKGA